RALFGLGWNWGVANPRRYLARVRRRKEPHRARHRHAAGGAVPPLLRYPGELPAPVAPARIVGGSSAAHEDGQPCVRIILRIRRGSANVRVGKKRDRTPPYREGFEGTTARALGVLHLGASDVALLVQEVHEAILASYLLAANLGLSARFVEFRRCLPKVSVFA